MIDLSGIDAKSNVNGNQAFHFVAAGNFTHTIGDLIAVNSGANTIVSGDTNGNGAADFSILVVGATGLTAGDFIL